MFVFAALAPSGCAAVGIPVPRQKQINKANVCFATLIDNLYQHPPPLLFCTQIKSVIRHQIWSFKGNFVASHSIQIDADDAKVSVKMAESTDSGDTQIQYRPSHVFKLLSP